jgi:hypothetical protein
VEGRSSGNARVPRSPKRKLRECGWPHVPGLRYPPPVRFDGPLRESECWEAPTARRGNACVGSKTVFPQLALRASKHGLFSLVSVKPGDQNFGESSAALSIARQLMCRKRWPWMALQTAMRRQRNVLAGMDAGVVAEWSHLGCDRFASWFAMAMDGIASRRYASA